MSKELTTKTDPGGIVLNGVYTDKIPALENFLKKLNEWPEQENVKINDKANNSLYQPISVVENNLDEIYLGLWQTRNFTTKVVANEIIGEIELSIFHPVIQQWITRTGVAAVQIQMRSIEKGGSGDITNIRDKYSNTLVKDYPHLKAECVKNAAKTFGKIFGRDLNRKDVDTYNPIYSQEMEIGEIQAELEARLNGCNDTGSMLAIWNEYTPYHSNPRLKKIFASYRSKLAYK